MFFPFNGKIAFITMVFMLVKLKLYNCIESEEDIRDICELNSELYPEDTYNISEVLHTYEVCLQTLRQYSGSERQERLTQLKNKLECFKEDLKQSFYAGSTKYKSMEMVESLMNETFFGDTDVNETNFRNARVNCNLARMVRSTVKRIIPLVLTGTISEKKKACDTILKKVNGSNITKFDDIPIPQLDNDTDPKQLKLPLKSCNSATYEVDSPESENALTQYYKVVMKCLTLTTEHRVQVFKFNRKFYDWLTKNVLPHLTDDKCYPAFGGVLQIVETMRQNDFVPKNATANFLFYRQKDLGQTEEEHRKEKDYTGKIFFQPYFLVILIPWLIFIVIIILFVVWRTGYCVGWCCGKKSDSIDSFGSTESVEQFYYPIDDTPSVSIDLADDIASEPPYSYHGSEHSFKSVRQRGGENFPLYLPFSYKVEEEKTFITVPMKRQWSSKETLSSGYRKLESPGKRQKKAVERTLRK